MNKEIRHEMALENGTMLNKDNYEIISLLYYGDNGFVYKANDKYSQKTVVIKEFCPPETISYKSQTLKYTRDNKTVALTVFNPDKFDLHLELSLRFKNESEVLKRFAASQHVVSVLNAFDENNTSYIVLEYLNHPTLSDLLKSDNVLTAKELWTIFDHLLLAVKELHSKQVIHRDLKPSNLFVGPDRVIIGDFGISKDLSQVLDSKTISYSEYFAAPEQLTSPEAQGTWTDVYAVGRILDYMRKYLLTHNSNFDKLVDPQHLNNVISLATTKLVEDRYKTIDHLSRNLKMKDKIKRQFLIALASLLVIVPIIVFASKDKLPAPRQTSDIQVSQALTQNNDPEEGAGGEDQAFVFEAFEFITASESILTRDKPLIEWTRPAGHGDYKISITDLSSWIVLSEYLVGSEGNYVDINALGLNSGKYRIYVFAAPETDEFDHYLKHIDIFVDRPVIEETKALFDQDFYTYTVDDTISIKTSTDRPSTLEVYDIKDMKHKASFDVSGDFNLPASELGAGMYYMTLKGQASAYSQCEMAITDNLLKYGQFINPKNQVFNYYDDRVLSWHDLEAEKIHVSLVNLVNEAVHKEVLEGHETSLDIKDLVTMPSVYQVNLWYEKNGQTSDYTKRNIIVLGPYLPAVVLENDQLSIKESMLLKWPAQEHAAKYILSVNEDVLESEQPLMDLSSILTQPGTYKFTLKYLDKYGNESQVTEVDYQVKE